jgi:hypothetical protein
MAYYPTRKLTVLALDPSVRDGRSVLKTQIEIPNESLEPGPRGYRVHVIDYDSAVDRLLPAVAIAEGMNRADGPPADPFENKPDHELLDDPSFHAFMTYGVIMKTLARFEYALGRRIGWSFQGHQIQVSPHAFADANAFYSDQAQGLFFGYFPSTDGKRTIFSCLSHEVIAHETTHALLDGLRERYMDPSSPQQAGFHEGFADIVAMLSVFSAQSVVAKVVDLGMPNLDKTNILRSNVTPEKLRNSALTGLAREMGTELSGIHGQALRRSVTLPPRTDYLTSGAADEAHTCGEILVAAVLNAYLDVWIDRLAKVGSESKLDRNRAAEEGAELAERLLTMCIRAIDYCPPTDLQFCDFASAVLTSDAELNPLDEKFRIRRKLIEWFRKYGIEPSSKGSAGRQEGSWDPPPLKPGFCYDRTHFDSMKVDYDEVFRFLWENRRALKLNEQAFTRVLSVRPCVRMGRDGFVLRETVVEYHQRLEVVAAELARLGVRKPTQMPDTTKVTLFGGNALIFDEYGRLKYSVGNSIIDSKDAETQARQSKRLEYLWAQGAFSKGASKMRAFARMHRRRATNWYRSVGTDDSGEE